VRSDGEEDLFLHVLGSAVGPVKLLQSKRLSFGKDEELIAPIVTRSQHPATAQECVLLSPRDPLAQVPSRMGRSWRYSEAVIIGW
jgi:hypothetical protein